MSMKLKKKIRELTGDDASQAAKIAALESAVGSKDTDAGSLKKRCADIESDATALEARVKALEDAQPAAETQSGDG